MKYESKWEGPGWYKVWEILDDGSLTEYDIRECIYSKYIDENRFAFTKIEMPEPPEPLKINHKNGWYLVKTDDDTRIMLRKGPWLYNSQEDADSEIYKGGEYAGDVIFLKAVEFKDLDDGDSN